MYVGIVMQPLLIHKNVDLLNKHAECKVQEGSDLLNYFSPLLCGLSLEQCLSPNNPSLNLHGRESQVWALYLRRDGMQFLKFLFYLAF